MRQGVTLAGALPNLLVKVTESGGIALASPCAGNAWVKVNLLPKRLEAGFWNRLLVAASTGNRFHSLACITYQSGPPVPRV